MILEMTEMRYMLTRSIDSWCNNISTRMAPLLGGDSHAIGLKTATHDY